MFPENDRLHLRDTQLFRAAFLIIGSLFLYTLQDALIKELHGSIHVLEIIFFRSLFSFMPILALMIYENGTWNRVSAVLETKHLPAHILRGFLMFLSLAVYVMACRELDLPALYTLTYSSPLFMTLLAGPLLGEQIGRRRLLCVVVGFVGVLIVMRPGTSVFNPFSILAVLSGLLTAIAIVFGRRLTAEDSNSLIVVMYSAVSLVCTSLALPFVWSKPTGHQLLELLTIGVLGGIAQYGFTHAFRLAPVSKIAPFDYASLIWAILFGYFLWAQIPDLSTLIGAGIIISMGLVIFYREHKIKRTETQLKPHPQEAA